jgi:hypothetical protein
MLGPHSPRQNYLLAALPVGESTCLYPWLELVPLPLGEVLYKSGDQLQHVCFRPAPSYRCFTSWPTARRRRSP